MRVVLDTNVIVAAFAARGLCAEVFEVCLTDHGIVLSEHILSEVAEKLIDKICLPPNIVQEIIMTNWFEKATAGGKRREYQVTHSVCKKQIWKGQ
ncbi:PIN domain-containing protein [Candidatus Acetothermia bacterium]|nr:PIN domain-containing protein [Candidatus Acetothermia bacterium]